MQDRATQPTIAQWRRKAVQMLAAVTDTPALDADLMLAAKLDKPRHWLRINADRILDADTLLALDDWLQRRREHTPLAYLLGNQPFWSLELRVTNDTLVPRPETELLVERALALLAERRAPLAVADLGTGSGNIALAIASERPDVEVLATDRSGAALAVAADNATRLGIDNVSFAMGDWCEPLDGRRFDIIASNPPYVESGFAGLGTTLRDEPRSALASGADGLDDLRRLIPALRRHLQPGGHVLLEHGHMQAAAVSGMLRTQHFVAIHTYNDLAGHPRITEARVAD